jgi:hypothetical protein
MNSTTFTFTIAAAAMMPPRGAMSAQSVAAEIPFPFQAAGARMQPGSYSVHVHWSGSGSIVHIVNQDEDLSVVTLPLSVSIPWSDMWTTAALNFTCVDGNCELSSLRSDLGTVYHFETGKKHPWTGITNMVIRLDRLE